MKKCSYCGRENGDEAAACGECGTKFATEDNTINEAADLGALAPPRGSKIGFIIAAWMLAMLAMLPLGGLLLFQPLLLLAFPSGLWGLFNESDANSMNTLVGCISYAAVITMLMLSRRRMWFILFYVMLCVMLATNVTGCYEVVDNNLQGWN